MAGYFQIALRLLNDRSGANVTLVRLRTGNPPFRRNLKLLFPIAPSSGCACQVLPLWIVALSHATTSQFESTCTVDQRIEFSESSETIFSPVTLAEIRECFMSPTKRYAAQKVPLIQIGGDELLLDMSAFRCRTDFSSRSNLSRDPGRGIRDQGPARMICNTASMQRVQLRVRPGRNPARDRSSGCRARHAVLNLSGTRKQTRLRVLRSISQENGIVGRGVNCTGAS
jgi:hypothetical protein